MDGRFQEYRGAQDEKASVGAFNMPFPVAAPQHHHQWMPTTMTREESLSMRRDKKRRRFRRAIIATTGGLVVLYLLLCTWASYQHNNHAVLYQMEEPHGEFPWPFPGHPPKKPHPRPPHHPHFPHPTPTVLGCTAVPTPTEDSYAGIKLAVTIPKHRPVVLQGPLLHGNVSVSKTPEEEEEGEGEVVAVESEGTDLEVHIKVANRTFPAPPPSMEDGVEEVVDEESEESKGFLLCAITFTHPHPPKHPDEDEEEFSDAVMMIHPPPHHPPRHRRPPPPVIVGIFPAHNETHPKFPGPPPGHRHSFPPHHPPTSTTLKSTLRENFIKLKAKLAMIKRLKGKFARFWRSTISFLFPMFSSSSSSSSPSPDFRIQIIEQGQFPSHPPPKGGKHKCPHGHPPPPLPPFKVVAAEVVVAESVHVIFGGPPFPFPPPFFRHHPPFHPHPHPHPHPPPFEAIELEAIF